MDLALRGHIAAGRPDKGRRERAADAICEYHQSEEAHGGLRWIDEIAYVMGSPSWDFWWD